MPKINFLDRLYIAAPCNTKRAELQKIRRTNASLWNATAAGVGVTVAVAVSTYTPVAPALAKRSELPWSGLTLNTKERQNTTSKHAKTFAPKLGGIADPGIAWTHRTNFV
jgi:mRNA deadenylase 3'-5' endonuclease subunit Ccr4